jgi:hypothetical protein
MACYRESFTFLAEATLVLLVPVRKRNILSIPTISCTRISWELIIKVRLSGAFNTLLKFGEAQNEHRSPNPY